MEIPYEPMQLQDVQDVWDVDDVQRSKFRESSASKNRLDHK